MHKTIDFLHEAMSNYSPIIQACINGNLANVRNLLEENASLADKQDTWNACYFPVFCAAKYKHFDILRLLVEEYHVDPTEHIPAVFLWCIERAGDRRLEYLEIFKYMVDHSNIVNLSKPAQLNVLHMTVRSDETIEYTNYLINVGININCYHHAVTPLICASMCGAIKTVQLLCEAGADKMLPVFVTDSPYKYYWDTPTSIYFGEHIPPKMIHKDGMNLEQIMNELIAYKQSLDVVIDTERTILELLGCPIDIKTSAHCYICENEDVHNIVTLECAHTLCIKCATLIQTPEYVVKCPYCRHNTDYKSDPLCATLFLCEFKDVFEFKVPLTMPAAIVIEHVLYILTSRRTTAPYDFVKRNTRITFDQRNICLYPETRLKELSIKHNSQIYYHFNFLGR